MKRLRGILKFLVSNVWLYLIIGLGLGILINPALEALDESVPGFLRDLLPEAVGIAFTVIILERIYAHNSRRARKIQLFNQLKSRANSLAIDAIEQLIREGWLQECVKYFYDASSQQSDLRNLQLHKAYLRGITLKNVDLRGSDLRSTDLLDVRLIGCDLAFCNLDGVFWGSIDLRGCDLHEIEGTIGVAYKSEYIILPDGTNCQSSDDWARFVVPEHDLYRVTRTKINEIRNGLDLPPLRE